MAEVSVDSSLIMEAKKLCLSAEKEISNTISLLNKGFSSCSEGWKDQKAKEFESTVNQCISSLKHPLKELRRCDVYLQQLANVLEEYESIGFSNTGNTNCNSNSSPNSNLSTSLNIEACNNAFARDGRRMQMVDISNINVDGSSDEHFWLHHGRSEAEWQAGMSEYVSMMQSYSNGMSIEQCYEEYPNTAGMVFGRDTIQLSDCDGTLAVSNGRHRIVMAQRLGISHLPAIVY